MGSILLVNGMASVEKYQIISIRLLYQNNTSLYKHKIEIIKTRLEEIKGLRRSNFLKQNSRLPADGALEI